LQVLRRKEAMNISEYITAAQAAEKQGIDKSRILVLLKQERIPGARLVLGLWHVPKDFTITPAAFGPALKTQGKRK
jgi:hypothetical protein